MGDLENEDFNLKKFLFGTISRRIIVFFIISSIVPLLIIGVISYSLNSNSLSSMNMGDLEEDIFLKKDIVINFLENSEEEVLFLSKLASLNKLINEGSEISKKEVQKDFLAFSEASNFNYYQIRYLDENGEEIYISQNDALDAIVGSERIIAKLIEEGLPTQKVEDMIVEAKLVFAQAKYANVLRDPDSLIGDRTEAKKALGLVNWQEIDYKDVLIITDEIDEIKKDAYNVYDSLTAAGLKSSILLSPSTGKEIDISEAVVLLEEAETAFYEDRYDEAQRLLEEAQIKIEEKKRESSALSSLQSGTRNFFERYWLHSIIVLGLLGTSGFFSIKAVNLQRLKKKVRKLKVEHNVLNDLIKDSQTKRFKEGKMSALVYNIKVDKYKSRMAEIKETLPVFEARLKKR